ncbi:MAG: hypothetical protein IAB19_06750 [Proteobacteria bacterium]|uniref:Uncharacterized protein n=1 Tax=Candidatus Avisuccinivibrio stercorigallinarum TaxID=2840704 RepID=A0A9D9DAE3_9GAMM|nr:hypothetical protein [Candidatus Avisuccinivibrio stercorigallinarum]
MARHAMQSLRAQSEQLTLQENQNCQRPDEWPAAEKGCLLCEKPNPIAEGMPGFEKPPLPNGAMEMPALCRLLFSTLPCRLLGSVRDCILAGFGRRGDIFYNCLWEEIPETLFKLQCACIKASHLRGELVEDETLSEARAAHRMLPIDDHYTSGINLELRHACRSHIHLLSALCKVTESSPGADRTGALNNAIARAVLSCKDPQAFEPYKNRREMLNTTAARLYRYGTSKTLICRLLSLPSRGCLIDDLLFFSKDEIRDAYSNEISRQRRASPYYCAFVTIGINFYEIILCMITGCLPRYLRGLRTNGRIFEPLAAAGAYDALRLLIMEASSFEPFRNAYGISLIPTCLEFLQELNDLIYGRSHFELCTEKQNPNKRRGPKCMTRFLVSEQRSDPEHQNCCHPQHSCPICELREKFMPEALQTTHAKSDRKMERAREDAYLRALREPPEPWTFSY